MLCGSKCSFWRSHWLKETSPPPTADGSMPLLKIPPSVLRIPSGVHVLHKGT